MRFFLIIAALFALPVFSAGQAEDFVQPPIEAYGERAAIRSMSLSPSGERFAYIRDVDDREILFVYSPDAGLNPIGDVTDLQGNWIWFATETHVIIRGYDTRRVVGYSGRFDYSGAFSYNLETNEVNQLLRRSSGLYPAQSGLGEIIGKLEGTNTVFMPAWTGKTDENIGRAVYKVDLDRERGRVHSKANKHTLDWLMAPDGTVLAREDMNNDRNEFKILTEKDGKLRSIFEAKNAMRPPYSVLGVTSDQSALILSVEDEKSEVSYVQMSFDGAISPVEGLWPARGGVQRLFRDKNRTIHGVEYSGIMPSYFFFDVRVNDAVQSVVSRFGNTSIKIVDHSEDWSKILLTAFDNTISEAYITLDVESGAINLISEKRPAISSGALGQVEAIEYQARDGLTIPAVLTWPAGIAKEARANLPTIIMPHGGPRSYDQVGFDWLAQYFANRGYLVLQPNFRGSTGFTSQFMLAGNGEWAGKMQDDVTDGLDRLIRDGYTDPSRVCIIGWSYGGYAALAGGAFTPDKYQCVVAIAPVTDLIRLFEDEEDDHGDNHFVLDYWREMIGDIGTEREKLESTSPVNSAETFQAPVLLIHGKDDRIVGYRHSTRMEQALRKASKYVQLVLIDGEGHSMLDSENRLKTLQAASDFVESTIGQSADQ